MLKAVIIDDEKKARIALKQMLGSDCPDVQIADEAEGVEDGLLAIKKHSPDVVFLDIKMKDGSGFDLIKKLSNLKCKIIFVTGYQEYAINAFRFSAIDFLLKPVHPDDLADAIKKASVFIEQERSNKYLESLLENFAGASKQMKKIALRTASTVYVLNIADILYCKSDGNYTEFYCTEGRTAVVSKQIGEYEELFSDYNFVRIHHSYLVNLSHIVRFDKNEGGSVTIKGGESIPVSARKRDHLMGALNKL